MGGQLVEVLQEARNKVIGGGKFRETDKIFELIFEGLNIGFVDVRPLFLFFEALPNNLNYLIKMRITLNIRGGNFEGESKGSNNQDVVVFSDTLFFGVQIEGKNFFRKILDLLGKAKLIADLHNLKNGHTNSICTIEFNYYLKKKVG